MQGERGEISVGGTKKDFGGNGLQNGMQTALKKNAVAAEFEHLFDFFENFLEAEDVAVFGADGAGEGAEETLLGAEIGVVHVAIDLVGGDARIVLCDAERVRGHADAVQVIGS